MREELFEAKECELIILIVIIPDWQKLTKYVKPTSDTRGIHVTRGKLMGHRPRWAKFPKTICLTRVQSTCFPCFSPTQNPDVQHECHTWPAQEFPTRGITTRESRVIVKHAPGYLCHGFGRREPRGNQMAKISRIIHVWPKCFTWVFD